MVYEVIKLRDHFLDVLSTAQTKYRKMYPNTSDWIEKEHEVMLSEVNRQLQERQRPSITMDQLLKAEQLAVGHSDYSSKFSLYCAEITLGTFRGIP